MCLGAMSGVRVSCWVGKSRVGVFRCDIECSNAVLEGACVMLIDESDVLVCSSGIFVLTGDVLVCRGIMLM